MNKLTKEETLLLLKFLCSFAWTNQEITDNERRFMGKIIRKLGLNNEETAQVYSWLEVPPSQEEVDPSKIPMSYRELFLNTVKDLLKADGPIDTQESEALALFEQILNSNK